MHFGTFCILTESNGIGVYCSVAHGKNQINGRCAASCGQHMIFGYLKPFRQSFPRRFHCSIRIISGIFQRFLHDMPHPFRRAFWPQVGGKIQPLCRPVIIPYIAAVFHLRSSTYQKTASSQRTENAEICAHSIRQRRSSDPPFSFCPRTGSSHRQGRSPD